MAAQVMVKGVGGVLGRQTRPLGPPTVLEGPLLEYPDSSELRLVKLSNILGIDTRPFDPASFEKQARAFWIVSSAFNVLLG